MSDFQSPFRPAGPAVALLASDTAPSATLINLTGDWSALVYNRSTSQDAYLAWGPTSAAVNTAIIPLVGTPQPKNQTQNVVPIPHGAIQTFTFSGPTYFGGLATGGNTVIDLSPGIGF